MILDLLEIWKHSYKLLIEHSKSIYPIYGIDQSWKTLHTIYRVFAHKDTIYGQLPGVSDIEGRYVNYTHAFEKKLY
jgi:hypothetical protein